MTDVDKPWWIFKGSQTPHAIKSVPASPSWRNYKARYKQKFGTPPARPRIHQDDRGATYVADERQCDLVNTALLLRRPLLVTGSPGSGKTALAYAVAHELQLGPVLLWPITTRSNLQDALYRYDAIGRLHGRKQDAADDDTDIGKYIRLGPVGSALLPSRHPRVLLIDEIDKSDIDLPNDLLHIFEEGAFEIPELSRLPDEDRYKSIKVGTHDEGGHAEIPRGRVHCYEFPFVVMTSNNEREFPPAFLRRCLHLEMPDLRAEDQRDRLYEIIERHLHVSRDEAVMKLIEKFTSQQTMIATDQLLNAIFLLRHTTSPVDLQTEQAVREAVMRDLSQ